MHEGPDFPFSNATPARPADDRQIALLRLLADAQRHLVAGAQHPQGFREFLDGLMQVCGCRAGMIAELGEDESDFMPRPLATAGTWDSAFHGAAPTGLPPVIARALRRGESYCDSDELATEGFGDTLAMPVKAHGRIVGIIALSDRAAPFAEDTAEFLSPALSTAAAMFAIRTGERLRRRITRDLRASQNRIRAIFGNIQEGAVIVNEEGAIVGFNAAAERMFGYTLKDMLGRRLGILLPGGEHPALDGHLPSPARREILVRHKDGKIFPAEISISRVDVEQGSVYIAILQDITERKQIERLKSELVTTVGHDLRTPLTSILGALSLVNSGALPDEKCRDLLAIAERNGRRLMRLITDLLDLERINAGMIPFTPGPTNLGEVLHLCVDNQRPLTDAKRIAIRWTLPEKPLLVHGDADRIAQIVTNILGNAVHFSPDDAIIDIRAVVVPGAIRVEVADQGPGIPEDFLPVMFDRFRQVAARIRRAGNEEPGAEGSGLGLSIVRALVELHGGKVGAVSPPGEGATVFFELPDETAPEP